MKRFLDWLGGLILAAVGALAWAQAPVEISFYYPVAVGGPITKIVDGLAADFEKENSGIKVKPIYSGTYQESIVKALTAQGGFTNRPSQRPVAIRRSVHSDDNRPASACPIPKDNIPPPRPESLGSKRLFWVTLATRRMGRTGPVMEA